MSGFSDVQVKDLSSELNHQYVFKRQRGGRELSYIPGWFVIAEANAIFGLDGWDRETTQLERVYDRSGPGGTVSCAYMARVRVTVRAGHTLIKREGTGVGIGAGLPPAEAYERALKAAETDATKRALLTFGSRFGLSLYAQDKKLPASSAIFEEPVGESVPAHVGKTDPLPANKEVATSDSKEAVIAAGITDASSKAYQANPPVAATILPKLSVHRLRPIIDKSVLSYASERRIRSKQHLSFVAAKPCLVCEDTQCHAHHVTFAQSRGLSVKVSDEFTVPLCGKHHNELHQVNSEKGWWKEYGIDALGAALKLWEESLRIMVAETT